MTSVFHFESTGEAYDASQVNEEIKDGDVLVVKSERVVGFLFQAWPVALTEEFGEFHTVADGVDPRTLEKDKPEVNYDLSVETALEEIKKLDEPVTDVDRARHAALAHYTRWEH
jgi:hypothetical protein